MKVWLDGKIVDGCQARVPVTDHGLLYGDGIFEGMRVTAGRVFRLQDHLSRLETGARALGLTIPGGTAEIERIVLDTARASGQSEAYIRLIVTRGEGALGVDPSSCERPRVICIVDKIHLYPEGVLARGLHLVTSSWRRAPADVLDPRVKSLNYLGSVLAKREARLHGADEALLLNTSGAVAEASVANLFVVRSGAIATPPTTDGALDGITRDSVLKLAAAAGIPACEATLGRVDLFAADEVFLTGTGARIVPVSRLDDIDLGQPGCHPITDQLTRAFDHYVTQNGTPIEHPTVSGGGEGRAPGK